MESVMMRPNPGWVQHRITPGLRALVGQACRYPIHTLLVTALAAAMTYLHVLEGSYRAANVGLGSEIEAAPLNIQSFLWGSRTLRLGATSSWRWQVDDLPEASEFHQANSHWALVTLNIPDTSVADSISLLSDSLAQSLGADLIPHTPNFFTSSDDASLAFRVPYFQLSGFLEAVESIASENENHRWIIRSPRGEGSHMSLRRWLGSSWLSFLHRAKHAETVDLVIIGLGYLAMNLTVVSLFRAMRHLGSRFWLAASVLLSGTFAFILGLGITTACRVPVDMLLLWEGIPFLVLTIGFEKPIQFTRTVLDSSKNLQRSGLQQSASIRNNEDDTRQSQSISKTIQLAVDREGWHILRSYLLEIGALGIGAALRPQESLGHFCFLAVWILLVDATLLFTFYATILCVKLEVTRIQGPGALHQADAQHGPRIFGYKVKPASVARWKLLMVGGFVLFNVLQLSSFFYRFRGGFTAKTALTPTPVSPFRVAANGLNDIYLSARREGVETRATVLMPVRYVLESSKHDVSATRRPVFEGVLAGLESPLGRLWLIGALVISLILNNHLIQAARWHALPRTKKESAVIDGSSPSLPRAPSATDISSRSPEEIEVLFESNQATSLTDDELLELCLRGKIAGYSLEKTLERITAGSSSAVTRLEAFTRAVRIRRAAVSRTPSTQGLSSGVEKSLLPYRDYNYELVHGACCENVIGYLPLPLGLAGPMVIDGQAYFIPMATTEGVLVASASRGCKAINAGGGAVTMLKGDGMTRGPCLGFPSASRAAEAQRWVESSVGHEVLTTAFNATSRFARLQTLTVAQAGTYLYIRFRTTTGDAMGMNMISKGVEKALEAMAVQGGFPDMHTITLSGNFCADKKSAAINWIGGRGKSVIAEATIPADTVRKVLKTEVDALVELNTAKNLVGSAMAASIGGFNAHASNLVQAVFLATGQDPAQNVESSSCITTMKNINGNLHIAVSMPSMEVGTIGGGTILEAQGSMLDLLGVRGAHPTDPGANARRLARIVAAAVLAGELSTCSALAAGHLVNAHMQHNRSAAASARK
ncbi:3-hydroxy-3-methylglutaryl-coenzyme A reductase [Aspergillus rambellii]|uniref:3-hydroxy-3-methylglutaryl coenzyme A reductase n=1 Tax=Aspergillus rambellii TaxID=308745 RepID=A0A0F8XL67_9EURO|nr:3-hydroxy-3-methylglutaryl-coenzyme A reductase [Aspergillus rambellii]